MALTQEDLQAIGALLEPIRTDIAGLKQGQAATNARLDTLSAGQKTIQANIITMQADLSDVKQNQSVMQIQLHRLEDKVDIGFKETQNIVAEVTEVVGSEIQVLKGHAE